MFNYTDALTFLIRDLIACTPEFGAVDPDGVLVFARASNTRRHGLFAACHALQLADEGPTHYLWRDRRSGRVVRQSPWFVLRPPEVTLGHRRLHYLVSFMLPRFCNETLALSPVKRRLYPDAEPWIARLDTVVHELYHMAPGAQGIRTLHRSDGSPSKCAHSREFYECVAGIVHRYLGARGDSEAVRFLQHNFRSLTSRYGGVTGLVFKTFPLFPRCVSEQVDRPPAIDGVPIAPLPASKGRRRYTEVDLDVRQFLPTGSRWAPGARAACRVLMGIPPRGSSSASSTRRATIAATRTRTPQRTRIVDPRQLKLF